MKVTYSLSDLNTVASSILSEAKTKTLLFYGEMGIGKTTLIKELAKQLGVRDTLSSPTFSIVNEYNLPNDIIYHFDFYRLNQESEAMDFGVEEYFYSGHWNFVEWPEKVKNLLPQESTKIELTKNNDGSRTLNITPVN